MNFCEFVHTNFVFVRKTSNLFIQIYEGFQHVMLQMACTVILHTNLTHPFFYGTDFMIFMLTPAHRISHKEETWLAEMGQCLSPV